jgi:hypothetical protein
MNQKPINPKSAAANKAWQTRRAKAADDLPPHSLESEMGALSCVLQAGNAGSQQNSDLMLQQLRPAMFYDARTVLLHREFTRMRMANVAIDSVTLFTWLRNQKREDGQLFSLLEDAGGIVWIQEDLQKASPTPLNFPYYTPALKEFSLRRWLLRKQVRIADLAKATDLSVETLREEFSEIYEQSTNIGASNVPLIHVVSPAQARAFEANEKDFLVGQGLVSRGMFVTIGGQPGVGKSRLATTLAIAGARGYNRWMNYPVRCKWRTLVLQSENDAHRLKEDCQAIPHEFNDDIRFTDSLSHGMAFDKPEFRRELRRLFEDWPFEMMVIDPWNDVSSEDGQKDYKQAMLNISACFRGVQCPAIVIVAHLRKRGRDDNKARKSGRDLLDELSGSLALGSSSRTVFTVQAVDASMEDSRIVFDVAKANNVHPDWLKEHGGRSAWTRANGAFERIENFDFKEYDNPGDPDRRKVTEEMITTVFNGEKEMRPSQLAKRINEVFKVGQSTVFRAIEDGGYLSHMLMKTETNRLALRNGNGH